jgi:uncharacterized repeat protein (TIGR01451 family)
MRVFLCKRRMFLCKRSFRAAAGAAVAGVLVSLGAQSPAALGDSHSQAASHSPIVSLPGPPGFAMLGDSSAAAAAAPAVNGGAPAGGTSAPTIGTYIPPTVPSPGVDLPAGSGSIMPSMNIHYVFWLPTGDHFESDDAGDTNYENLLIQFAKDWGSNQYHNLLTQYNGTNGTIGNTVTYGGMWVDTSAYPHAGTTADPLQDGDIQKEVASAVSTNHWNEGLNDIVAVFTANGIHECNGSDCTFSETNGFCAYHKHFTDGSNDSMYAFMAFDNFTHVAAKPNLTCLPGGPYPNGDVSADSEINTLSHELAESQTDPHPNDTWTAPNPEGEIGDACNFFFSPRNDAGADVYLNGDGYVLQMLYSNAAHNCAIDLPTNGFCAGSVSQVCSPTNTFTKSVDNASPRVKSTINYTVTVNNTNDTGAETNATLSDTVPSGYAVTNVLAPNATTSSFTSSSVTVNYDTLPVHQQRTVTITATVPVQAGTTATNCAKLDGFDLLTTTAIVQQTTSPCASTTPVKIPTVVTYTGPTSGDYNDQATVSATLTDDLSNPLSGKTIVFKLNGTETCSGTTDLSGNASCKITPGETAGPYALTAAFNDATDPVYATSSTSPTFNVTLEEDTIAYTGPTVILAGGSGVTLSGRLLEDGTTPISGRTLKLGVGTQTCTGTTNGSGVASCPITFTGALGSEGLSASFTSDGYYQSSSDTTQTAIVFAFPTRGAFVLGDKTVAAATSTTNVTWWGDTWWKLNSLSGGTAPSAFKGFAGVVGLPTSTPPSSCGGNWATSTGNSPPPTSGVPSYMGVLVTKNVAQMGNSSVRGDTISIVVVKVAPGYGPSPSSHGTGTIVAVYC